MTESDLAALRTLIREELAPIRADLDAMRPHLEGIPLIQRAVSIIQQEQRMMKAAVNDLARTQFTSGEVDALHSDVNAVQSTHLELERRIVTLERQMKEALEELRRR
jgi:hypothetical protein